MATRTITLFALCLAVYVVSASPIKKQQLRSALKTNAEHMKMKRAPPVIPRFPTFPPTTVEYGDSCSRELDGICRDSCLENENNIGGGCSGSQVCCKDDGDARGDPHYTSFDGKTFASQGKCSYILTQDCLNKDWKIVVHNEEGLHNGRTVSRVSSVDVDIMGSLITFGPGYTVTVDGNTVKPDEYDFGNDDLHLMVAKNNKLKFYFKGHFDVLFDGEHKVDVNVTPLLANKVCGLLGNNDGDPSNDFMLSDGTEAANRDEFIASWQDGDC